MEGRAQARSGIASPYSLSLTRACPQFECLCPLASAGFVVVAVAELTIIVKNKIKSEIIFNLYAIYFYVFLSSRPV